MFTQTLIDAAKDVLSRYNKQAPEADQFPVDRLEKQLKDIGAVCDDDLRALQPEDLNSLGIRQLQARQICTLFRNSKAAQAQSLQYMVVRTVRDEAAELSNLDLIIRHLENPVAQYTAVAQQLNIRSRGQAFLVQNADGSFDTNASANVLEGIAQGEEYNGFVRSHSGRRIRLYHVGECGSEIKHEDPLHPGRALRRDGTSVDDIYWGNVSLEARQLVRLCIETGEIVPRHMDHGAKLDLRDRAQQGFAMLQERYPEAALMFEDRKELNSLPMLKVRNSRNRYSTHRSISAPSPTNNEDEYEYDDDEYDDDKWGDEIAFR